MPIIDEVEGQFAGLESPIERVFDITPNDDADLEYMTRIITVGGAGNVAVHMKKDDPADPPTILKNLQPGQDYPRRVRRVFATGTTATDIQGGS
ncbi:spike base protein, RCAP_Rcc01079 family [Parasedimentitalea huanghaiensis]|uniref:Uncharacterized protein n=1 Tax=Parasedimentitalea huanghaiensis TaxID=2682100 RepID=A0A6L6WD23_9RHOB|nr:hypothetical protein [Zongyanglinia huanghaiensis]MVO14799.1 hypothetical protein [Zongyanglinia huanghaiensis]